MRNTNVNTPYDDVFRTLLTDCSSLIIPVVNEIFHENYTGEETVTLKENELFLKQPDGGRGKKDHRFFFRDFRQWGREALPHRMPEHARWHHADPDV